MNGSRDPGYFLVVKRLSGMIRVFSLLLSDRSNRNCTDIHITIDGVRTIDPNNVQVRRDVANYQNFFIVPGAETDLYFQKNGVPHGTLHKAWYNSSVLGMDRRVYIYTPVGYEKGNAKYPVFYLLHGASADEDAWTSMGRAVQIMDNLIAQGKAKADDCGYAKRKCITRQAPRVMCPLFLDS